MTTPCYATTGCAAGSQVCGDASCPCAWRPAGSAFLCVNFNNGNVNNNDRNDQARVRVCRSALPAGEFQGADEQVSLKQLHTAWQEARRGKNPSVNQLRFDARWIDGLIQLEGEINSGTWSPRPSTCFIADRPKAREIHAPDFADRIVHHLVVPPLEARYEPRFIHDSYANRRGKGTHAAVTRLQQFVRQVHSGQGGGFFLQLDIHNCFNCVRRETLYGLLKRVMERTAMPLVLRRIVHALLRRSPLDAGVTYRATAAERALVPAHKRLENAPTGCGIPIGNLSSQFFINVYLNELDQFVKHVLKVPRYVRYVDDFVLVHHDRAQLAAWHLEIEKFLASRLHLSLKADVRLRPLTDGIDFLGYVIRPTHTLVRRRVVSHAREALAAWGRRHVDGQTIHATPEALRVAGAVWGSYRGHLQHADSWRLERDFHRRFPWLAAATTPRSFPLELENHPLRIGYGEAA
jgi:RNA-directed DNA polymerase